MQPNNSEKSYWGIGLTIAIIIFMVLTLGLLFFSTTLRFDQVTQTHYEDAAIYQERINAIKRTRALTTIANISLTETQLSLTIPTKSGFVDSAIVKLYKPDNQTMDRAFRYESTQMNQSDTLIYRLTPKLIQGKWIVKASWWSEQNEYYKEQNFLFD